MKFEAALVATCLISLSVAHSAAGQTAASQPPLAATAPASSSAALPIFDGPPAPEAPSVVSRDDRGRATIRAVRIDTPLKIDGRLDEEVYSLVLPVGGYIQQEPNEGAPATQKTDSWVLFDEDNIYVVARCWDDQPASRWVMDELRRDSGNIMQDENFSVTFDTFLDRRNGFYFQTTPIGAVRDQTFTDERTFNANWNTVWEVKSGRFDGGWTVEMSIPFKSLRYRGSGPQVWGINLRRMVAWKNEVSLLTKVPAAYGPPGIIHMSAAGTLVGLETPAQSMNLELKPYAISAVSTDRSQGANSFSNRVTKDVGFDFKYGLTRSLTADATYNTDFAQVEEDLQQVNLTRFSLQFPEKRDFFLEGNGVFLFAGGGGGDVPIMFFSRQIGTSRGQAVPVLAGGRLTGTTGKYGIGLLNVQTEDKESAGAVATNFSVVRVKRDILRRSNIGFIATSRTPTIRGSESNRALAADANLAFFRNLSISSYYARTDSPGATGDQSSYRGLFDYAADRYGLQLDHLSVGDTFTPEIGFTRRKDFHRSTISTRFSPRPKASRYVRKLNWNVSYDYITDGKRTRVENRQSTAAFQVELHNTDVFTVDYTHDFEYLPSTFEISPKVILPVGGYNYSTYRAAYTLGQQRDISGKLTVASGSFYDGTKREATFTSGRLAFSSRISVEPGITLQWVDLPQGNFKTRLVTARTVFTPSPRILISSLSQFNAADHSVSSSLRLRWEYRPSSELFVVYSDGRNTAAPDGLSSLINRSLAIKATKLLRF